MTPANTIPIQPDLEREVPDASEVEGLVEEAVADLAEGTMLQFERFGFVRLEERGPPVRAIYAHR